MLKLIIENRVADGSASLHDFGLNILLRWPNCSNHVAGPLATQLLIPLPLADTVLVLPDEWFEVLYPFPVSGYLRRTVLETRLDALPEFQLPFVVLRFRCHRDVCRNGCNGLLLFRKILYLFTRFTLAPTVNNLLVKFFKDARKTLDRKKESSNLVVQMQPTHGSQIYI